ncbi:MAG: guanylate kinase [Roseburia sp.]|nr:guanylate kinase [Roseburia sp.]
MFMRKGILVVISGFSGAGKGTIMKELIKRYDYHLSVSATTRKPRTGETEGIDYYFHTREEFQEMIEQGELIEWAEYVGNYYGTPRRYVEEQLEAGKDVLLEIEMQGGMLVKEKFPEALLIFVSPPSGEILKERLTGRGTESPEEIEKRLLRAVEEVKYMKDYDYIIVNDDLEDAIGKVKDLIEYDHYKSCNSTQLIEKMESELGSFAAKGE